MNDDQRISNLVGRYGQTVDEWPRQPDAYADLFTEYVATNDERVLEIDMEYWEPMLEAAESCAELRADLVHSETTKWLLGLEFMFMERREFFPTLEDVRHFTRTFVLHSIAAS